MAKVYQGVCWDSKRKQAVYTLPDLMAAYDPRTKQWRDMKPQTVFGGWDGPAVLADHFYEGPAVVLAGDPQPGPPPCYGLGTCYDPVNDQILLFPHFGAVNLDLVQVNGNISGTWGRWFTVSRTTPGGASATRSGREQVRKAREALLELIGKVSRATDSAWALRRRKDAAKPEEVSQTFAQAVDGTRRASR